MGTIWDQHACVALSPTADLGELERFGRADGGFVSLNVGYSPQSWRDTSTLLDAFAAQTRTHPRLAPVAGSASLAPTAAEGRFTVAFDLEDAGPLEGDLDRLSDLQARGLRTLAPTYNHRNRAGCGCLDTDDTGLTSWGRELVAEMEHVGIVPDGSHGSAQTGLDMCRVASGPMVYSHSCMRGLWEHPRNITDDQARACADTGGVVGITGVGIFLGPNTPTLEAMAQHLEYLVELVGIEHAGVSSDYSFDFVDFRAQIAATPELFDESYTRWGPIDWMPPETFVTLGDHLAMRGWGEDEIAAVIEGNFRRVATQVWR